MFTPRFRCLAMGVVMLFSLTVAALEPEDAAHLLRRTGFAPTPDEVAVLLPMSREEAVDHLLDGVRTQPMEAPPSWATQDLGEHYRTLQEENQAWSALPPEERQMRFQARRREWRQQGEELMTWWLEEMVRTDSPLTERLVLFWHNHFTTELRVIDNPVWMYEQHRMLRERGLENFGRMVLALLSDPAMFRYLDSNSNTSRRPNENFARELMELYTLGEGNYSEEDITDAARAFTGYRLDKQSGRPVLDPLRHDGSRKQILGHRGNFDGEGIIIRLLQREADVALNITRKMWITFIGPAPDITDEAAYRLWQREVHALARAFYADRRHGHYFIRPLLRKILLHEEFWAPAQRGALLKSPIELVVGTYRQLGLPANGAAMLSACRAAGQEPFNPPNVKGWPGHTSWINPQSLIARNEFLSATLKGYRPPANHWLGQGQDISAHVPLLLPQPLALPWSQTPPLAEVLMDPLYQLQ